MARRQEKTSEKLKLQEVQKYDYRQKTARILYCGMQAGTHQGEIRCGACGKKVREMQDYTGQHATHVLYCQMSSLVQPCSRGKNVMPRRQRLSELQMRIRIILKIMSKKYSGRQRREGVPCVVCRDTVVLYSDMDQRHMKNFFLNVNAILCKYFIPFKPFTL